MKYFNLSATLMLVLSVAHADHTIEHHPKYWVPQFLGTETAKVRFTDETTGRCWHSGYPNFTKIYAEDALSYNGLRIVDDDPDVLTTIVVKGNRRKDDQICEIVLDVSVDVRGERLISKTIDGGRGYEKDIVNWVASESTKFAKIVSTLWRATKYFWNEQEWLVYQKSQEGLKARGPKGDQGN